MWANIGIQANRATHPYCSAFVDFYVSIECVCAGVFGIGAREDTASGFRAPDLSVALLLLSHNRDEKIASILVNLAPSSGGSTHESPHLLTRVGQNWK